MTIFVSRMYSDDQSTSIHLPKCEDFGVEQRYCHEKCSIDGRTCLLSLTLKKCTCKGIELNLQETAKLDFKSDEILQNHSKSSKIYGMGYVRKCGDCSDFCSIFPGEERGFNSTQKDYSCK